jgi:hypothetical protein
MTVAGQWTKSISTFDGLGMAIFRQSHILPILALAYDEPHVAREEAAMKSLIFMSPEHVSRMNELLAESDLVLEACAELDRGFEIAYELEGGPDGTVYWVLEFSPDAGAMFSLAPPNAADLTFFGNWAETIRSSKAVRDGDGEEPVFEMHGDSTVLTRTEGAFRAAQSAATVPVEFPDTEGFYPL